MFAKRNIKPCANGTLYNENGECSRVWGWHLISENLYSMVSVVTLMVYKALVAIVCLDHVLLPTPDNYAVHGDLLEQFKQNYN